jgi:hypothetical protein
MFLIFVYDAFNFAKKGKGVSKAADVSQMKNLTLVPSSTKALRSYAAVKFLELLSPSHDL